MAQVVVSGEGTVFESGAVNMFRSVQSNPQNTLSIKYISDIVVKQSKATGMASLARSTRATETITCSDGGTMSISGTEASANITYANCSMFGITMNGVVSMTYSGSGDVDYYVDDYQENMSLTFNNVTTVENIGGITTVMDGTIRFIESYTAANQRTAGTDTIPSFKLTAGVDSFSIYNTTSDWAEDYTTSTWDDSGVFEDSSVGVFSFETLTTFEQNYGSYPHAGKMKMLGLDSSLTATIVDTSSVTFELDSDGDDVIDETWTVAPSTLGFSRYY